MQKLFLLIGLCLLVTGCREIVEKEAEDKVAVAETALEQEEWEVADNAFYEAILLDPERPDAWIGRGLALTQLGDEDYARTHYKEALALYQEQSGDEPAEPASLRHQIMLLVLLNRSDEASALAKEAAEHAPDDELALSLPQFVERMEKEFADMILPPDDEEGDPPPSDLPHSLP